MQYLSVCTACWLQKQKKKILEIRMLFIGFSDGNFVFYFHSVVTYGTSLSFFIICFSFKHIRSLSTRIFSRFGQHKGARCAFFSRLVFLPGTVYINTSHDPFDLLTFVQPIHCYTRRLNAKRKPFDSYNNFCAGVLPTATTKPRDIRITCKKPMKTKKNKKCNVNITIPSTTLSKESGGIFDDSS